MVVEIQVVHKWCNYTHVRISYLNWVNICCDLLVKNSFILFRHHCPIEWVYKIYNGISKNHHLRYVTHIKIIKSVGSYSIQIPVINSVKIYTFKLEKSNRICELKHACDIKICQPKTEEKFGRQPVKLSRKKTTKEEDVALNEELIKICLEAVEKYVAAKQEGKFHLSLLEDREAKVCQYCNFRAICRIQEAS